MKLKKTAAMMTVLGLLTLSSAAWAADDGAALYKSNCAMCHKADASGNPGMKAPALKGKSADDVKKAINEDAKHASLKKKLTAAQVKAIGEYVAGLK